MRELNWPSPKELCREYGIEPKKSLGQNFLSDPVLCRQMADSFRLTPDDSVLEIGPGLGHLTVELLKSGAQVTVVEIDQRFQSVLESIQSYFPNLTIQMGDALGFNWSELHAQNRRLFFCGNLPYLLSTELFIKALTELPEAQSMSFLLQKEAALRLTAPVDTKSYSPASILATEYGQRHLEKTVGAGSFYPHPTIQSLWFRLEASPDYRLEGSRSPQRMKDFSFFLKDSFQFRRKTLRNNWSHAEETGLWKSGVYQTLSQMDSIQLDRRAESCSPKEWIQWYLEIEKQKGGVRNP